MLQCNQGEEGPETRSKQQNFNSAAQQMLPPESGIEAVRQRGCKIYSSSAQCRETALLKEGRKPLIYTGTINRKFPQKIQILKGLQGLRKPITALLV
jgi:hypothetical protein